MMATPSCEVLVDVVARADDADGLAAIRQRDVALAIWPRPLPAELNASLAQLEWDEIDDVALTLELPATATALATSLIVSGYGEKIAGAMARDITALAERLATIARCSRLKLRLDVVETDACRRFHADLVTYRLLTTYRGQATQWLRSDEIESIEQMRAGDVGIFKGRVLIEEPTILHRSPRIEHTGERRLLLVLDPVIAD